MHSLSKSSSAHGFPIFVWLHRAEPIMDQKIFFASSFNYFSGYKYGRPAMENSHKPALILELYIWLRKLEFLDFEKFGIPIFLIIYV